MVVAFVVALVVALVVAFVVAFVVTCVREVLAVGVSEYVCEVIFVDAVVRTDVVFSVMLDD